MGRATSHRAARVALVAALSVGLGALYYGLSVHSYAGHSDKASTILEGQAVGEGHLLLHGWVLPLDSFWTIDQLFYAVVTRIGGLHGSLLHLGPAFFATVFTVVGSWAASASTTGRRRLVSAATVVVLLALPAPELARFFLGSGYHIGTAVLALLAFVALRRTTSPRRWVVAALLLAGGLLGDLLTVAYGVVPVLLAGGAAMLRRRDWRAGAAPAAAALSGCALAVSAHLAASAAGGYALSPALPTARPPQMWSNLTRMLHFGSGMLGITHGPGNAAPGPLLAMHLFLGVLMLACLVESARALVAGAFRSRRTAVGVDAPSEPWRLEDMLLLATFGPAATFVLLSLGGSYGDARYLAPSMLFLAVLAGTVVARASSRLLPGRALTAAVLAGSAPVLASAAAVGYQLATPAPVPLARGLASWLAAHDLRDGLGDYGDASITTVLSSGEVAVRPVVLGPSGKLVRIGYHSSTAWYAGQHFQFLVYQPSSPAGGVDMASAVRTWGRPDHVFSVGPFRVLEWSHPITVQAGVTAVGTRWRAWPAQPVSLRQARPPRPPRPAPPA